MKKKEIFDRYRARLIREGVIKAVVYGVIGALGAIFVSSLVSWFFGFKGLWLSIGLGLGVGIIVGTVLYFSVFRPTEKEIAKRVDGLGLEERIVTMMELEGNDSYIAKRQREDAREKLATVKSQDLTFRFAKKVVVWAIALLIAAPSMAVVSEFAANDKIKSGLDIVNPPAGPVYVEVSYVAEDGGEIEGEVDQIVLVGETSAPVIAVAEDGWVFVEWDDGISDPFRDGDKAQKNIVYTAIFEKIDDNGGDGEGDGEEGMGEPGDVPGEIKDGDGDSSNSPYDPNGEPGGGAGGDMSECNQIINGETPYAPNLSDYVESMRESTSESSTLSDALKSIISTYFDSLG